MTAYRDRMNAGEYAAAEQKSKPADQKQKPKRSSAKSTPTKETPKNA
jgi:hypothetical protein